MAEAIRRNRAIHAPTSASTTSDGARKTIQDPGPPAQETAERRLRVMASACGRGEILPNPSHDVSLPDGQNSIGKETIKGSRCMDAQLSSDVKTEPLSSRRRSKKIRARSEKGRGNGPDKSQRATQAAKSVSPEHSPKTECSARSARSEESEETESAGSEEEFSDFAHLVDAAANSTEDEYLPDESGEGWESSDSE